MADPHRRDLPEPLSPEAKPRPGEVLGDRYELVCSVAEGGMGTVWLARALHDSSLVAVKTILPSYAWDPKFQRMFLDETHIASRLVHPNVARILDVGEWKGLLYFVMEWVDGDSVRALLKVVSDGGAAFPAAVALRITSDVCAGLHAAHEARHDDGTPLGVVHRDISPQNVLVTQGGVTKIIDFGIAMARGRAASETATGEIKGKARYMAPEQAMGCTVDRRADVWAATAVLYEMLTGRPLTEARTPYEAVKEMMEGYRRKPLPPTLPPEVAALVNRGLAPDLDERFASADHMRRTVDEVMVRTGLHATNRDVAAFTHFHLQGLMEERAQFVASALQNLPRMSTGPTPIPVTSRVVPRARPSGAPLTVPSSGTLRRGDVARLSAIFEDSAQAGPEASAPLLVPPQLVDHAEVPGEGDDLPATRPAAPLVVAVVGTLLALAVLVAVAFLVTR